MNTVGTTAGSLMQALERHPLRALLSVVLFFALWKTTAWSVALFWSTLALALSTNLPAGPVFLAALLALAATPALYLLDRPAQAERAGVLVFSLLALGILINLAEAWRASARRRTPSANTTAAGRNA